MQNINYPKKLLHLSRKKVHNTVVLTSTHVSIKEKIVKRIKDENMVLTSKRVVHAEKVEEK